MDALAHFGNDGFGTFFRGGIALGQHDLAVARRPMSKSALHRLGPYAIVSDAIVDNRAELTESLSIARHDACQLTDAQLILRSYARWGSECVSRLVGDFAFAIWDHKTSTLFLARDHVGARPLYWSQRGDTIMFSTDVRGLVAFRDFDWQISDASVARYLLAPHKGLQTSLFSSLEMVAPGHFVLINDRHCKIEHWWQPLIGQQSPSRSEEDYADGLRHLVDTAVRDRTTSNHPVAAHLSGGYDSSVVACVAARWLRREGKPLAGAFSWSPAISTRYPLLRQGDERTRILELATNEHFDVFFGTADGEFLRNWLDSPLELDGTVDVFQELPVVAAASALGIRTILSGWGGDEAASTSLQGYIPYLLRRGHLLKAAGAIYARSNRRNNPRILARTLIDAGARPLFDANKPSRAFGAASGLSGWRFAGEALKDAGISPEPEFLSRPLEAHPHLEMLRQVRAGHLGARMATWASWSAWHGIQHRYPLADRRIMEYMLTVPAEHLFGDGLGRYLLRASTKDLFSSRPTKLDRVNELLRSDQRLQCWQILAKDVDEGLLDSKSEWIDLDALRSEIRNVPDDPKDVDARAFSGIRAAIRVIALEQRNLLRRSGKAL